MCSKRALSEIILLLYVLLANNVLIVKADQKPMVIVIPSYNNEQWVEVNLLSAFNQKYDNFRIIYIDDCSKDATYQRVIDLVNKYHQQARTTVIHNQFRCGALANLYKVIHSCKDNEIIVTLDGDDWLAHDQVLSYLNTIYSTKDIWLTYGQFIVVPSTSICESFSKPFSEDIIQNNSFRKSFDVSHLRTMYAWLFKTIAIERFLYEGNFYCMAWDTAFMSCAIEMAARHHYCVPDILYVYNQQNQISDFRINRLFQLYLHDYIIQLKPYVQLDAPRYVEQFDQFDHVSLIVLSNDVSADVIKGLDQVKYKFKNSMCHVPTARKKIRA